MSSLKRFLNDPTCVLAESLSEPLVELEKRGWTVNGNPQLVKDEGRCTEFDGTGDYLTIIKGRLQITTNNFTILIWVKTLQTDTGLFIGNRPLGGAGTVNGFVFGVIESGKIFLHIGNSDGDFVIHKTLDTINDGKWHLCAITIDRYSSSGSQIYINGLASGSTFNITSVQNSVSSIDYAIGRQAATSASGYFNGKLRDFLVFNRVLSAQEVLDIYNQTTFDYNKNLVSLWKMDSPNPRDMVGSNDGVGTSLAETDIVDGHNGRQKATQFDGSADKVVLTSSGNIRSIGIWFSAASTGEEILKIASGKFISITGGNVVGTGITLTDIYINGISTIAKVLDKFEFVFINLSQNELADVVEFATDGTGFGNCKISEVRIYNKALTQLKMADLYFQTRRL